MLDTIYDKKKVFALKNVKIEFNRYIHLDFVAFMRFSFIFIAIKNAILFATTFDVDVNKIRRKKLVVIMFVVYCSLLFKTFIMTI